MDTLLLQAMFSDLEVSTEVSQEGKERNIVTLYSWEIFTREAHFKFATIDSQL